MTDLFDDDDLFAPRPAPVAPVERYPVASFACRCGAQDEVREPAPARLDCWSCHEPETMRRYRPAFLPPRHAGRQLTALERRGLELDSRSG